MTQDERWMREAVALSRLAMEHGNEPFGALLVKDGQVVMTNENQIYSASDLPRGAGPAAPVLRPDGDHEPGGVHPLFQLRALLYVLRGHGVDPAGPAGLRGQRH